MPLSEAYINICVASDFDTRVANITIHRNESIRALKQRIAEEVPAHPVTAALTLT